MDRRTFLGLATGAVVGSRILPAADALPAIADPSEVLIPAGASISLEIKPFDCEDVAIIQASLSPGKFVVRCHADGSSTVIFRKGLKRFPLSPRPLLSLTKANGTAQPQEVHRGNL